MCLIPMEYTGKGRAWIFSNTASDVSQPSPRRAARPLVLAAEDCHVVGLAVRGNAGSGLFFIENLGPERATGAREDCHDEKGAYQGEHEHGGVRQHSGEYFGDLRSA